MNMVVAKHLEKVVLLEDVVRGMSPTTQGCIYKIALEIYSTGLFYGAEIGRGMGTDREQRAKFASRRIIKYLQDRSSGPVFIDPLVR